MAEQDSPEITFDSVSRDGKEDKQNPDSAGRQVETEREPRVSESVENAA